MREGWREAALVDRLTSGPVGKGGIEWPCKGANVGGTYRVTGDSHQGIGLSGVSCSAFGSRLRVPAADGRKAEA